jgi:hypothetical protein
MTDNSDLPLKIIIRKKYLLSIDSPRVLDLFCGLGKLYNGVYRDVEKYHGVDSETIHDLSCCTLQDNIQFIKTHRIDQYNVFDLDAYGSPILQLMALSTRPLPDRFCVFMTDGLASQRRNSINANRVIMASLGMKKKVRIVHPGRFYLRIMGALIQSFSKRANVRVESCHYARARTGSKPYYWAMLFSKV